MAIVFTSAMYGSSWQDIAGNKDQVSDLVFTVQFAGKVLPDNEGEGPDRG